MAQAVPASAQTSKRSPKDRLLLQIKSLDDDDDDRTSISKKISWILRHGAKPAGVKQDPDTKWVKFSDLCEAEILKEWGPDFIWQVIIDFNGKKLRYEINEEAGGPWIRAHKRDDKYKERQRRSLDDVEVSQPPERNEKAAGLRGDAAEFKPGYAAPTLASDAARITASAMVQAQAAPTSPTDAARVAAAAMAQAQAQMQAQAQAQAQAAQAQQAALYTALQQQMGGGPWNYGGFNPMMPPHMPPHMHPLMWQHAQAAQAQAAAASAASAAQAPGKFSGRIKSFNGEKGFGFIECTQTHAQYNRDVFLHKAQIGDLKPGDLVSFSCEVNKQDMPQAKDVQFMGNAPPGTMQPPPAPPTGGGGKGGPKGFGGKDVGKGGKGKGAKGDKGGREGGRGKGAGRKGGGFCEKGQHMGGEKGQQMGQQIGRSADQGAPQIQ